MLTKKQKNLLMFINKKLRSSGVSPSYEEMKESLNLKSKSGIHRLISALEERGFVKRLARRAYGDGLFPGFGGTPFFYARQLSGFVESVDRRNIVDKATFRFYRRMSNPEMLRRILAERAPAALSILDEKDPSGTLMREILEHFQNPTVLTDQDLIRVVQALVDVDDQIKFSIGVPKSPAALLREAGFDVHGLQDADIDMLLKPLMDDMINHTGQARKTYIDPETGEVKEVTVPDPLAASHALQQAIEQLIGDVYERARKVAIVAGLDVSEELERARHVEQRVLDGQADDIFDLSPEELQNELHSRLFEVYDSVFTQVKTYLSGGNEAALTESQVEAAHGYALQAMMSASKAIRDMEEAKVLAEFIRGTRKKQEFYEVFQDKHSEGFDPEIDTIVFHRVTADSIQIAEDKKQHVKGIQGQLWSETITKKEYFEGDFF